MLGKVLERVTKALLFDVADTPRSHAPHGINATKRLRERSVTSTALVPLNLSNDSCRSSTDRAVKDGYRPLAVFVKLANYTAEQAAIRLLGVFGVDDCLVWMFFDAENGPVLELEDVSHAE